MSIQTQCREAMTALAAEGGLFTEIDVVNKASHGKGWTEKLFREAMDRAYAVLQQAYKGGNLVRFGPVTYHKTPDYARKATKIIYADAKLGPKVWDTPNGQFPALEFASDPLAGTGRKSRDVLNRDDSTPWDSQKPQTGSQRHLRPVEDTPKGSGPPIDTRPLERRIQELERERDEWKAKAEEVVGENTVMLDLLAEKGTPLVTERVQEAVKERVAEAMLV